MIRNMVSLRCKMIVKAGLERMHLQTHTLELGEAEIKEELSPLQWQQLKAVLLQSGVELLEDKKVSS